MAQAVSPRMYYPQDIWDAEEEYKKFAKALSETTPREDLREGYEQIKENLAKSWRSKIQTYAADNPENRDMISTLTNIFETVTKQKLVESTGQASKFSLPAFKMPALPKFSMPSLPSFLSAKPARDEGKEMQVMHRVEPELDTIGLDSPPHRGPSRRREREDLDSPTNHRVPMTATERLTAFSLPTVSLPSLSLPSLGGLFSKPASNPSNQFV